MQTKNKKIWFEAFLHVNDPQRSRAACRHMANKLSFVRKPEMWRCEARRVQDGFHSSATEWRLGWANTVRPTYSAAVLIVYIHISATVRNINLQNE